MCIGLWKLKVCILFLFAVFRNTYIHICSIILDFRFNGAGFTGVVVDRVSDRENRMCSAQKNDILTSVLLLLDKRSIAGFYNGNAIFRWIKGPPRPSRQQCGRSRHRNMTCSCGLQTYIISIMGDIFCIIRMGSSCITAYKSPAFLTLASEEQNLKFYLNFIGVIYSSAKNDTGGDLISAIDSVGVSKPGSHGLADTRVFSFDFSFNGRWNSQANVYKLKLMGYEYNEFTFKSPWILFTHIRANTYNPTNAHFALLLHFCKHIWFGQRPGGLCALRHNIQPLILEQFRTRARKRETMITIYKK